MAEREYMSLYLRAEGEYRVYKRVGYDLLSMLGELGGFGRAVMVFCAGLTSIFSHRLFAAALIRQTYRIQKYFKDTSEFYKTSHGYRLTSESESKSSSSF